MKKIILKDVIKSKNERQKKNIGCVGKIGNVFFACCLLLVGLMFLVSFIFQKGSNDIIFFWGKCFAFLVLVRVFIYMVAKAMSKNFKDDINTGDVKVFIEKVKLINKHNELEYSYVPNTDRCKMECYIQLQAQDREYTLNVGYDTYKKFKIGEELYVIEINNKNYSDLIYRTSEYELDEVAKDALGKEIIIKI